MPEPTTSVGKSLWAAREPLATAVDEENHVHGPAGARVTLDCRDLTPRRRVLRHRRPARIETSSPVVRWARPTACHRALR
jgi:hypothetical protein